MNKADEFEREILRRRATREPTPIGDAVAAVMREAERVVKLARKAEEHARKLVPALGTVRVWGNDGTKLTFVASPTDCEKLRRVMGKLKAKAGVPVVIVENRREGA